MQVPSRRISSGVETNEGDSAKAAQTNLDEKKTAQNDAAMALKSAKATTKEAKNANKLATKTLQ